ncbi:MAG TPA: hypothetical protein ENK31_07980 [Nannocystis exedens]|nr:hypothetical protein [Nannocystis exedens]
MAAGDDSSPDSEKSGVPAWLTFLGLAGAVGGVVGLACYYERRQRRESAKLANQFAGLMARTADKADKEIKRLVASASDEVSSQIETQIEERVGRRLDAADARFNRRIDQVSDSAASAVEQILREANRRTDEVIREAGQRLAHVGWLDEAVTPSADDSGRSSSGDDDSVWADLNDFQRQFES